MTMLEEIARKVLAGEPHDEHWDEFRVKHFPGRGQEEAAAELGAWAREHGIEPDFYKKKMLAGRRKVEYIFVLLTAL